MSRMQSDLLSLLPNEETLRVLLREIHDPDQLLVLSRMLACRTRLLCDVVVRHAGERTGARDAPAGDAAPCSRLH
jgi:hypothetical protein